MTSNNKLFHFFLFDVNKELLMITNQSCITERQLSEVDVWQSKQRTQVCKTSLEIEVDSVRLILDKSTWCTVAEAPEEVVVVVALVVMDVSVYCFRLIKNKITRSFIMVLVILFLIKLYARKNIFNVLF